MSFVMVSKQNNKHLFAFHIPSLSLLLPAHSDGEKNQLIISDPTIFHRLVNVLRMNSTDECIIFDGIMHALVKIEHVIGKKQLVFLVQSIEPTYHLMPSITFLLPVLKRDNFEEAVYALAELGVTIIQPVFTDKTSHQWTQKDSERAQKIIIAAAEQSKNFAYPQLKKPIFLKEALQQQVSSCLKLFFDPQGKNFFDVVQSLYNTQPQQIVLLIGPEGDLNNEEKIIVHHNNFISCALTSTIIRSTQAAILGAGFVRSFFV